MPNLFTDAYSLESLKREQNTHKRKARKSEHISRWLSWVNVSCRCMSACSSCWILWVCRYYALAPVHTGAPSSLRATIIGDNMGLPISLKQARTLGATFGSAPWMFPRNSKMKPDESFVCKHSFCGMGGATLQLRERIGDIHDSSENRYSRVWSYDVAKSEATQAHFIPAVRPFHFAHHPPKMHTQQNFNYAQPSTAQDHEDAGEEGKEKGPSPCGASKLNGDEQGTGDDSCSVLTHQTHHGRKGDRKGDDARKVNERKTKMNDGAADDNASDDTGGWSQYLLNITSSNGTTSAYGFHDVVSGHLFEDIALTFRDPHAKRVADAIKQNYAMDKTGTMEWHTPPVRPPIRHVAIVYGVNLPTITALEIAQSQAAADANEPFYTTTQEHNENAYGKMPSHPFQNQTGYRCSGDATVPYASLGWSHAWHLSPKVLIRTTPERYITQFKMMPYEHIHIASTKQPASIRFDSHKVVGCYSHINQNI
eukprot:m.110578 g.110578  ORF g.110578 m.110578 type:complete len:481 (-) comp13404_c2_seq2:778-2220(-)